MGSDTRNNAARRGMISSKAREILRLQPDSREVQSLISVGRIGQGLPPQPSMPPGLWVVFYGSRNHHMMAVSAWDESSEFLEFETQDLYTLQAILDGSAAQTSISIPRWTKATRYARCAD